MKNLSIGKKISFGFSLMIIIACILGTMAIWNMKSVENQSKMLAHEYVPEVDVAVELRGAANRVMYEMRGYGFTEEEKFYKNAEKELDAIELALERARILEAGSPNLKKLKGQLNVATQAVNEYKGFMKQTKSINAKMAANRKILDESAAKYMSNSSLFLAGQNEKFKIDLHERQKKIGIVTLLVEVGSEVRVTNFKAQALGDFRLLETAINKIGDVPSLLTDLRKISRSKIDIKRMVDIESAAKQYENAMQQFLIEFKRGSLADLTLMDQYRKEMDKSAGIYVLNCEEFFNGQQKKLTKDMLERTLKIFLVNDIINLGNETRIGAFKSQAMRRPVIMENALKKFIEINKKFEDLKLITYMEADLDRIEEVRSAGNEYKAAMNNFLQNWMILQDLGNKRGRAGQAVIDACKTTADAGMSATDKIANGAVASLGSASVIMMIGLIISLVVGIASAFFIVRGITVPVNRITRGMKEGSIQVASASIQVSSSSQSMADGASQQAASIEETSSSMEEMASMTKQNAENARHADGLMKEANLVVITANDSMKKLTKSMEDISKASEETSKIIKTIDEIAFQTNLLALNAAVEAARAGEAGAGFAVVADEVRNLAMRASDAAKDTSELIEGTVKKISDGSQLVAMTNDAFTQVSASTAKVGDLVSEISEASREQSTGIDQVNNAITQMDKVVQQNAANAEESASSAEEMSAQAEQLKEFVGELVLLVTGRMEEESSVYSAGSKSMSSPKTTVDSGKSMLATRKNEVSPEQIIPFDDDEFKDF